MWRSVVVACCGTPTGYTHSQRCLVRNYFKLDGFRQAWSAGRQGTNPECNKLQRRRREPAASVPRREGARVFFLELVGALVVALLIYDGMKIAVSPRQKPDDEEKDL